MSLKAEKWAWGISEVRPRMADKARLILVKLAMHANSDHETWPGVPTLARAVQCDEKTVRRHLDKLAKDGVIVRKTQQQSSGRGRGNDRFQLQVQRPTGHFAPKNTVQQPDISDAATGHLDHDQPDISDPPTNTKGTERGTDKRTESDFSSSETRDHRRKLPMIDEVQVTEDEFDLAASILDHFNLRNGSKLSLLGTTHKPTPSMTRIVMRMREHPELQHADYERIIDRNFENPWWDEPQLGQVGPIFGPKAFGRAMGNTGVASGGRTTRRDIDRPGRTKGPGW